MGNKKFNRNPFFEFSGDKLADNKLGNKEGITYIPFAGLKKAASFFKQQQSLNFSVLPKLKAKSRVFLIIIVAVLIVFSGRLIWLQLYQASALGGLAEGNRIRNKIILSQRGVISDRNGELLVRNVPIFNAGVVPVDLPKDEGVRRQLWQALSEITGVEIDEIEKTVTSQPAYSYELLLIGDPLTYEQALRLALLEERYSGVKLNVTSGREYLHGNALSLSHVLGYLGKIGDLEIESYLNQGYAFNELVGKVGLEAQYESLLKGSNGRRQVETDALGREKIVLSEEETIDGKNLKLTIDLEFQTIAESSLNSILQAFGKKSGSVIVLNPNNGEVLAMVSLPAFNSNSFVNGIDQEEFNQLANNQARPLFNRSVAGQYPSGSTFKMVVSAAALEEGVITPQTSFLSSGGIAVDRWFFPDWKFGGHGVTNLTKALAESVNTFFYIIGGGYNERQGLGIEKLNYYAQLFGLTKKTGIDLPNEAEGFFPTISWKESVKQERWYIGDTYNASIGQGDILVTPLQVANWTAVFANGGTLYRPHLIKRVEDNFGNLENNVEPKVIRDNFISTSNVESVKAGLRRAVTSGSAVGMSTLPISTAGKTGTAQWSSKDSPHAWFTSFAPYEKPEIVVTVLVEEGGEGSSVALPVAREIISWWANNRYGQN
ncbi:MAG: penicillin-binding protein 2 [Candidatus Buchananbacteria bacterium CG10_big_fil_rev_8_21_14_0_10_42_9]|uniref:Penicillin-binding protein 2 n=1 Tax=Candidatus Buchananbacteria bacterium CG10_big_fil_rev_8_21_14_0_10_42_9 TaxID=1974526 RepID=A0A2H0W4J9_9BACT|nr:MAG: penicillin-binding protein 2 [Candidatus Buchananbacteria bacterium CG10_big_fil_rev_8_21_14_0_10_42_9]